MKSFGVHGVIHTLIGHWSTVIKGGSIGSPLNVTNFLLELLCSSHFHSELAKFD